jgi:hypothetical protein
MPLISALQWLTRARLRIYHMHLDIHSGVQWSRAGLDQFDKRLYRRYYQGMRPPGPMLGRTDSPETDIKAQYASIPFFILTSALVKLSIFIAIHHMSPNAPHRRVNLALEAVAALWYVPATLTSIFQCALPTLWDFINGTRCVNIVRPIPLLSQFDVSDLSSAYGGPLLQY